MTGHAIRWRLTLWYAALTLAAVLAAGLCAWALFRQSVDRAADRSLAMHLAGVQRFLDGLEPGLTLDELRDEFRESADLSLSDALLQVTDAHGQMLSEPKLATWRQDVAPALQRDADGRWPPPRRTELQGRPFEIVAGDFTARGEQDVAVVAVPLGPAAEALDRARTALLLLVPIVAMFAGGIGYIISGRALAPVDSMTRAAQAITVKNLDQRLDVPAANDELRRLALTFNNMLERLHLGVMDMARLTADASHELRTPVTLVRTNAELALRRERSPDEYRQALTDIHQHALRMSSVVDDLLLLARTDAAAAPRAFAPVDLTDVGAEATADAHGLAAQHGVALEADASGEHPRVSGDAESLRRVVAILLDNAIKYTPSGGTIRVHVSRGRIAETDLAIVDVIDEGIGIDPHDQPFVFDRFYRGGRARERVADGSGLGLAIARAIADQHRATLTLTPVDPSRPDRAGCRARLALPAIT